MIAFRTSCALIAPNTDCNGENFAAHVLKNDSQCFVASPLKSSEGQYLLIKAIKESLSGSDGNRFSAIIKSERARKQDNEAHLRAIS